MGVIKIKCTDGTWIYIKNPSTDSVRFERQCKIVAQKVGKVAALPIEVSVVVESKPAATKNTTVDKPEEKVYEQMKLF